MNEVDFLYEYPNVKLEHIIKCSKLAKKAFEELSDKRDSLAPSYQAISQLNEITKLVEVLVVSLLSQLKEMKREGEEAKKEFDEFSSQIYYG